MHRAVRLCGRVICGGRGGGGEELGSGLAAPRRNENHGAARCDGCCHASRGRHPEALKRRGAVSRWAGSLDL